MFCKRERLIELLRNVQPMMIWKIKCLYMFEIPPPLPKRGGWVVRSQKNDKKPPAANQIPQTNFIFANL